MTVSETISMEAVFLGISILAGAALFLLYDVLRIFRRIVPHGNLWIGVEDLLYWMIYTGVVFVMLYRENDGRVRGFAIGGLIFGMFFYFLILSRYVVGINVLIFGTIAKIVGKALHFIFAPIKRIGKKTTQIAGKQLKKFVRTVKMCLCKR